eukprot:38837_1
MATIRSYWILLWIYKLHTIHSAFHMINDEATLKQYTFYYESDHYDIPNWSSIPNQSISIIDHYNNTITYNSSLFLIINHQIILHYHHGDGFNEIQHTKPILPIQTPTNRRRLKRKRHSTKYHHHSRRHRRRKRRKNRRKRRRKKKRKQRSAVASWLKRWKQRQYNHISARRHRRHKHKRHKKSRYASQGRFVGYFNADRRGSTYKGAHSYCRRKYGELASIGTKRENEQVKRVCRVILGDKKRNGYYCWLGLYYPFEEWTDKRRVEFRRYSPQQKHLSHAGRYTGKDKCVSMYKKTGFWYHQRCNYRNGVVCSKPRGIYVGSYLVVQKQYRYSKAKKICKQWYGTNLATIHNDEQNHNVRRACQKVSDNGHCWIGLETPFKTWGDGIGVRFTNWAKGEPNNMNKEGCAEIYPSGRWNNIPCRVHRYPVCNSRSLWERMDGRLREYLIRKSYIKFRNEWSAHQQQRWMEKKKRERSANYKLRKQILKQMKWRMRGRVKEDLATRFWNAQQGVNSQRKMGYEPLLSKKMLYGMYYLKYGKFPPIKDPKWMRNWFARLRVQKAYKRKMQKRRLKKMIQMRILQEIRKRMAMENRGQGMGGDEGPLEYHSKMYGDLDRRPFDGTLSISPLRGMNKELRMVRPRLNLNRRVNSMNNLNLHYRRAADSINQLTARRLQGVVDEGRKCVLVGNIDGLQEICVGMDYIEIKRYVKRVRKEQLHDIIVEDVVDYGLNMISNVSDVAVDYIDFENWKYKKGAYINEYKMVHKYQSSSVAYEFNLIENVEEEVYYATRYEVMVDLLRGARQCWVFMEDERVQLCVTIDGKYKENGEVRFEVSKGKIGEDVVYDFNEDSDWDEVVTYSADGLVSKCVHLLQMKICIEIENEPNGYSGIDAYEVIVLTPFDNQQENEIIF